MSPRDDLVQKDKSNYVRLAASVILLVASAMLTVHVFFIHQKFKGTSDNAWVEISGHETVQMVFILVTLGFYILAYCLQIWQDYKDRQFTAKRLNQIEKKLNMT